MMKTWFGGALFAAVVLAAVPATAHDNDGDDREEDDLEARYHAEGQVTWRDSHAGKSDSWEHLKILGFNDFHGQLDPKLVGKSLAGGAAALASYLEAAGQGFEGKSLIIHAGDQVGASPPDSALLQDEPAITFLNLLANKFCQYPEADDDDDRLNNPHCNVVGTLGNHEFDEGRGELFRLLDGGNFISGPFLEDPWRGARFPYVNSNVFDVATGRNILPPFVVRKLGGVQVGVIGAVLKETPTIVTPTGVAGLSFQDEADSINKAARALKMRGVHAIIVTIHQGVNPPAPSYNGPTDPTRPLPPGPIADIVSRLDDDVDLVISGHSHTFTNGIYSNGNGKPILVVQAFSASTAYDDIDLWVDPRSGDVVQKSASVITTWLDTGPGLTPDPDVAAVVAAADAKVAPLVNKLVGHTNLDLTRTENAAGESTMGDLISDAQREAEGTDFNFMNVGGIRNDIPAGDITWGQIFTVQPFGNSMVSMKMTGQQVYNVLEQQWGPLQGTGRIMKTSGFTYTWDSTKPAGGRIVEVDKGGVAIDKNATYTVSCNNFMAAGGDNFTEFTHGTDQVGGPVDLDVLEAYVTAHSPLNVVLDGRIARLP